MTINFFGVIPIQNLKPNHSKIPSLPHILDHWILRQVLAATTVITLSGCQLLPHSTSNTRNEDTETSRQSEQNSDLAAKSQLSAELLYDLLVADIANQRSHPDLALESLSRAAYQTRDRRIIADAISLAMSIGEYEQAIGLTQLLNRLEPDNYAVSLTLARAHFEQGKINNGFEILINLINVQDDKDTAIFQDVATILARQNPETVLNDFQADVNYDAENEKQVFTAALLASRIENVEAYSQLLDDTLNLKPDWEIPGILKLNNLSIQEIDAIDIDAIEIDAMEKFALRHLKEFPAHERFRVQYARLLIQQDQIDDALVHLEMVLKDNPDSTESLFTVGAIYLERGLFEQAKAPLSHYLEINPSDDQVRMYLAEIEFEQENYTDAAYFLHGISSERHYIDAQVKLARIKALRENVEAGLSYLQQIDTISDDETARIILEQDLLLRDHDLLDRALLSLGDGLNQLPDHPDLLYNRGLLAAQLNMLEVHEADMRKLIQIQPDNAHAYNALGYTLADQTDRLEEAMELISHANKLLPNNAFILDSMGWIHFRLGQNEQALDYLRQALVVRQDAEIAAHLGEVLWTLGNTDEALEIWKKGTQWGPDNAVLKATIERLSQQQSHNIMLYETFSAGTMIYDSHPAHSIHG